MLFSKLSKRGVATGCEKSIDGSAQSRLTKWFNTACFSAPSPYGFGSESRTDPNLRFPGIANYNFALFKNTKIGERYGLQFRTEFFNIFNRVQFGPPRQYLRFRHLRPDQQPVQQPAARSALTQAELLETSAIRHQNACGRVDYGAPANPPSSKVTNPPPLPFAAPRSPRGNGAAAAAPAMTEVEKPRTMLSQENL